jgi:peptidyl-prolyl cis-trans isomerase B (cyclophilin B)
MLERLARDPVASVAEAAASGLSQPPAAAGADSAPAAAPLKVTETRLDPVEMKRLASPRARVTVRGVGTFELALLPAEAPSTVLGFVQLAESGYYDGSTIGPMSADSTIGTRAESEAPAEPTFQRAEKGAWPHVRGTVGLAKERADRPGRIFINLVDNPRFDYRHTVFAQALQGLDVIDELLEGDIIERVEIVP